VAEHAPVEVVGRGLVLAALAALEQPHHELGADLAHREQVLAFHVGPVLVLNAATFQRVDQQAPHVSQPHRPSPW
jgi:hypothetical protein